MIDKFTIIELFIKEKFYGLLIDHWQDGQIRIDFPPGGTARTTSLVSIYPDNIYYVCEKAHEEKFSVPLELGMRWNSMWNKVPCPISDPTFFETLEKATGLALKNLKSYGT
jgi:hypothetical protein